jgi:hypothetical protein
MSPLHVLQNLVSVTSTQAPRVEYEGQENEQYTLFGALKASYEVNENFKVDLISSTYNTPRRRVLDIYVFYEPQVKCRFW